MSKRPLEPDDLQPSPHSASRRIDEQFTKSSTTKSHSESRPHNKQETSQPRPKLSIGGSSFGNNEGGLVAGSFDSLSMPNASFITHKESFVAESLVYNAQRVLGIEDSIAQIYTWLSRGSHEDLNDILGRRHRDMVQNYLEGTGSDFLKSNQLQDWLSDSSEANKTFGNDAFLLWCYGDPGVGKSTLFSQVVEQLRERSADRVNQCIIFMHCDFVERQALNHTNLLKWALYQATKQIRETTHKTPPELEEFWQRYRYTDSDGGFIQPAEAEELLCTLLKKFDRSFILIDGLDEYVDVAHRDSQRNEDGGLFRSMYNVALAFEGHCRMLVTSRPSSMDANHVKKCSYHITSAKHDLRAYMDHSMKRIPSQAPLSRSPDLRNKVKALLEDSPSFLLMRGQWRWIQGKKSVREAKECLKDLPDTLGKYYETEWTRLMAQNPEDRNNARRVIGIVFYAKRVLSIKELSHAMATRLTDVRFDEEGTMGDDEYLAHAMGFLSRESDTVHFSHLTARQFLEDIVIRDEVMSETQERLARICLTQLRFIDFENACDIEHIKQRRTKYPFWEYSARWAGPHTSDWLAANPNQSSEVKTMIETGIPLGSWQALATKVLLNPHPPRIPDWRDGLTLLQKYIVLDMDYMVHAMLSESKTLLETRGYKDETPLHTAARVGSVACAKVVLEHGASINARNYSGKNALDMIMIKPWQQYTSGLMELDHRFMLGLLIRLLSKGIARTRIEDEILDELDPEDLKLDRRAEAASTRWVLASGVKLDISDEEAEIVDLLLEKDIELDGIDGEATALQLATIYERKALVLKLLEKGANPFFKKGLGYTALEIAEEKGLHDLVNIIQAKISELDCLKGLERDDRDQGGIHARTQAAEQDIRRVVRNRKLTEDYLDRIASAMEKLVINSHSAGAGGT